MLHFVIHVKYPGSVRLKVIPEDSWFHWLWEFAGKGGDQSEGLTAASVVKSLTYEMAEIQLQCNESMNDWGWLIDHEDQTDSATQAEIIENKSQMSV